MCALFGVLSYGGKVHRKVMQKLIQALANASEVRGKHATGVAYNHNNYLTVFKRPKAAHNLTLYVPGGVNVVMGHTRFTTQGSQDNNINNHPFSGFAGTHFAFAHNGILYNDHLLKAKYNLPKTDIETDSYVAVQLIEYYGRLSFDSLKWMAEEVSGYFTFTAIDKDDNLWFVKGESPLYLLHFPELELYVYSSTREIMKTALGKVFKKGGLPKCELINVVDGDIIKIDKNGNRTGSKYEIKDDWFSYFGTCGNWATTSKVLGTTSESDGYDDETRMYIYDLAGYYGVEEDQIKELLDDGFTFDEIEEMLFYGYEQDYHGGYADDGSADYDDEYESADYEDENESADKEYIKAVKAMEAFSS